MSSGALWHIVESLYGSRGPAAGGLLGKAVPAGRSGVLAFVAVDDADNVHLLIHPTPEAGLGRLAGMRLKDVTCEIQEWTVAGNPRQPYLDLVCRASRSSALRRPFLAFSEDVLHEISTSSLTAEECINSVYNRWRRFWALPDLPPPTKEWVQGLWGELILLEEFIRSRGSLAVKTWTGPVTAHHDFEGHGVAIEVKTSARRPVTVKIHTLNQLDPTQFTSLYLATVLVSESPSGRSLPEQVRRVEELLGNDSEMLEEFWSKLGLVGYRRTSEADYGTYRFFFDATNFYLIGEEFPKITRDSFIESLDHRILDVQYTLELSGLYPSDVNADEVKEHLDQMCADALAE